jgi:hypothetical protein
MTNLLKELEAVAGLAERADQGCWRMWANELRSSPEDDADVDHSHIIASFAGARTHNLHFVQALVLLYRTHHAEIAEAVKGAAYGRALQSAMEAEYRAAKTSRKGGKQAEWVTTHCLLRRVKAAADHLTDMGNPITESDQPLAAIDAMHNSAREVGE